MTYWRTRRRRRQHAVAGGALIVKRLARHSLPCQTDHHSIYIRS